MTDVFLLIQHGWQNIWKQKTIWLFSALPVITQFFLPTYNRGEKNLSLLLLYLVVSITYLILWVISLIGVPYLAYMFSMGSSASIQETLEAVKKFSMRIIGFSCVGFLLLVLCVFFTAGIAMRSSQPAPQAFITAGLVLMPLSVFSGLWDFTVFGLFENDWGIRKSIKNAWNLFISHFAVLAILGIGFVIVWRISTAILGVVTVLLQSGFDAASLQSLNFVNPSMTLGKNTLFILMNGINQTIYNTLSPSVFVLAYLKYSQGKNRFTTK